MRMVGNGGSCLEWSWKGLICCETSLRTSRCGHEILVAVFSFSVMKRSLDLLPGWQWVQWGEERDAVKGLLPVLWVSLIEWRTLCCCILTRLYVVVNVPCCTFWKASQGPELLLDLLVKLEKSRQQSCKPEMLGLKQLQSSSRQRGLLGDSLQAYRRRLLQTSHSLSNHTEIFKVTKMPFQNPSVVVMLLFCVCSSDAVAFLLKQLKLFKNKVLMGRGGIWNPTVLYVHHRKACMVLYFEGGCLQNKALVWIEDRAVMFSPSLPNSLWSLNEDFCLWSSSVNCAWV